MEVICLETEAFYTLIEELYERLKEKENIQDKWISKEEALGLLKVKSDTTLQKLRDEGKIRFSRSGDRKIVYDRESIESYLEQNASETF